MIIDSIKSSLKRIPFIRRFFRRSPLKEGFVMIENSLSQNHIWMYLRKDSYMEREFLHKGLYGDWEKESLRIWSALSKLSKTIIDIGANTGVFSLLAQSSNLTARVIAIEPVDTNFEVLSKNISKNNFSIVTEKIALSDIEGTAKMFMLKDKLNYMTSINDNRYALHPEIQGNNEVVEIEVPIKPFSYIYEKYNLLKIDLIKIDVEGHEASVIGAMLPYLKENRPSIMIEVIGDDNAVKLDMMFREVGYETYISMDEINLSKVVDRLWDNDHHNFLICTAQTEEYLRAKSLIA